MKQRGEVKLVFPKKKPKTLQGIHRWHRKLLEDCIFLEFKKRTLEAGLKQINKEIQKYVGWLKEGLHPAKLALEKLNLLKSEWEEQLLINSMAIKIAHDTNEVIVGNVIKQTPGGTEIIQKVQQEVVQPGTNLLHEPGWLTEMLSAEHLERQGYTAFLTFGTVFDPGLLADVIGIPGPRRRRIRWKGRYPGRRSRRRKK